jgi:hypothetical protein
MKKMLAYTIILPAVVFVIAIAFLCFDSYSNPHFLSDISSSIIIGIVCLIIYYFVLMAILYFVPIGFGKKIFISVFGPLLVLGLMIT